MLQQKIKLVESMLRLIDHISSNHRNQLEIYNNLSQPVVANIISNFTDQNIFVRKVSAQLLCELLYNNQQVKDRFLQEFKVEPSHGNIVLSKLQNVKNILPLLDVIKDAKIKRGNVLCWYIRFDEGNIQYLRKGEDIIDPSECLFGIVNQKQHNPSSFKEFQNIHGLNFGDLRRNYKNKSDQQSEYGAASSRNRNYTKYSTDGETNHSRNVLVSSFQRTSEKLQSQKPMFSEFKRINAPNSFYIPRSTKHEDQKNQYLNPQVHDYKHVNPSNTTRPQTKSFHEILGYSKTNRQPQALNTSIPEHNFRQIYFKKR